MRLIKVIIVKKMLAKKIIGFYIVLVVAIMLLLATVGLEVSSADKYKKSMSDFVDYNASGAFTESNSTSSDTIINASAILSTSSSKTNASELAFGTTTRYLPGSYVSTFRSTNNKESFF